MNFDFLRNLKGLDVVYQPCKDAEELVMEKPYLSMMAARKSAELLAKFVYMAAHASAMEDMTFADILYDYQVRHFINNRDVIDAFHYIRKCGNQAVHDDQYSSEEEALSVLRNLHYVAGETAKDLFLIDSYPEFNENISTNADAVFHDNVEITEQAMKMFLEYIDKQSHLVPVSLINPMHLGYILGGQAEVHEYLEFDHQPYYESTLEYIQKYLYFMHDLSIEREPGNGIGADKAVVSKIELKLDGTLYSSNDEGTNILQVITENLPNAKHFVITVFAQGNLRVYYPNPDPDAFIDAMLDEDVMWQGRGMADQLEMLKRKERFIYKANIRYPDDDNHTEFYCIRNGKSYEVEDLMRSDFAPPLEKADFWGNDILLNVKFKNRPGREIIEQLRDAARDYIDDDLEFVENVWAEEDEDGEYGSLLMGYMIYDSNLSRTRGFIEQVNRILKPIAHECIITNRHYGGMLYAWKNDSEMDSISQQKNLEMIEREEAARPNLDHCLLDVDNHGVASFVWRDDKLQLIGAML